MSARILVLDDSEIVLEVIAMALEGAGYEVITLSDPAQLAETCAREQPAVAVVDIGLPTLSTDELADLVRKEVHAPVILYSDRGGAELAHLVTRSGARVALRKDPDGAELVREIDRLLQHSLV